MFSEAKARRVTQFIECLKHTKGEFHGEPFKLLPWQEKVIRDVFGTVRDDDPSMRQYNTAYIEIPKKNGKSTISSGITLYLLMADGEPGAEVYSAAADRDQASIIFKVDPVVKTKNHCIFNSSEKEFRLFNGNLSGFSTGVDIPGCPVVQ